MKKTKNVFFLPPDRPFLTTLAEGLLHRTNSNPEALARLILFLPTRRAARELRDTFLDITNGRPLLLPRMQALGDVDNEELDLLSFADPGDPAPPIPPAIQNLERLLLLARLIQKRPDCADYTRALALAQSLSLLLDQAQTEGIPLSALDKVVSEQFAQHWQLTLDFLDVLKTVWPALLTARGETDPIPRRNALLERLAARISSGAFKGPLLAAGINGTIPAAAQVLAVIASRPDGEILLPVFDPALPPEIRADLDALHPYDEQTRLLKTLKTAPEEVTLWPAAAEKNSAPLRFTDTPRPWLWRHVFLPAPCTAAWTGLNEKTTPQWKDRLARDFENLEILEAETQAEEARAIALRLRQILDSAHETALIVTPDRGLAARIKTAAARFGIPLNDSGGTPLSQTAPAQFLLQILTLVENRYHPLDLLSLLQHDLCALGQDKPTQKKSVEALDLKLLRGFRPPESGAELLKIAQQKNLPESALSALENLIESLRPLEDLRQTPASLPQALKTLLAAAETLAQTPDQTGEARLWCGEEGETLASHLIDLFTQVNDQEEVTLSELAALLRQVWEQILIRPRYGTHPRLRLLGLMESRLLSADHVILAGFNEDVWPGGDRHDPWMSRPMRRDFGLPPLERQIGRMAHDLLGLVQAAPNLLITRARRIEGAPALPSRWLQRLDTVLSSLGTDPADRRALLLLQQTRTLDEAPALPRPIGRPEPRPAAALRPQTLSVTRIETLMRSPYDLYAQKILRLRPLDDHDKTPDARDRGTIVHRALELFVQKAPPDLSGPLDPLLQQSLDQALKETLPAGPLQEAGRPRLLALLRSALEKDRAWRAEGHRNLATECEKHLDLEIVGNAFHLTAKIDRLDRAPDGSLSIIDYKTTSKTPSFSALSSGLSPQLPLEGLILAATDPTPVRCLSLWKLAGQECTLKNWDKPEGEQTPEVLIKTAQEGLKDLIAAFENPSTPYYSVPDPDRAPAFSDYTHLARLQEWSGYEGGEGEGE